MAQAATTVRTPLAALSDRAPSPAGPPCTIDRAGFWSFFDTA